MPKATEKSFLARASSWATSQNVYGPQAFLKFVIFNFLECLNESSDEFIFKGGNLLWIYIQTPRQTIDLDLATRNLSNSDKIQSLLKDACALGEKKGIQFHLSNYQITEDKKGAASATINYKTDTGAQNSFDLDIVFVVVTDMRQIPSPLETGEVLPVASIENIIADKLAASAQFAAGNTRMKDFDDLWRISKSKIEIDSKLLIKILKSRKISAELSDQWRNPVIERDWQRHARRYKDLPINLKEVFHDVNTWLEVLNS
jgi:predicted nucleotidyltransferase component of viral defense system